MSELIYPTLDLFLYQLRNSLGDSEEEVKNNHEDFWRNLTDKIKVSLDQELQAVNTDYAKLLELLDVNVQKQLGIKNNSFTFKNRVSGYELEGYYYPVRLYDIYGLRFDCSVEDLDYPQSVSCFSILKEQAINKTGNLGKIWMLSGSLPPKFQGDVNALAQDSIKTFTSANLEDLEMGTFLGAKVFEFWKSPQKWDNFAEDNLHIFMFIYPDLQTMKVGSGFYGDWLRLFSARSKILWEYAYSQVLTNTLQAEFQKIRSRITAVENLYPQSGNLTLDYQQLSQLQKILTESIPSLSKYNKDLGYLQILATAIETNRQNYSKYLEQIIDKARKKQQVNNNLGNTDLMFLKTFAEIAQQKYQAQVEQNLASLSTGLRLQEDLISTVRGIIEIEQAKRDRTLNNTIAIAGIGLATSQIASSAILAQVPEQKNPLVYQVQVFTLSLVIGLIFAGLTYLLLRAFRRT